MATKITNEMLDKAVRRLNLTANLPLEVYAVDANGKTLQPLTSTGNFSIESGYGSVSLGQNAGSKTIIPLTNKADLYDKIHLLIVGIEYGKRMGGVQS